VPRNRAQISHEERRSELIAAATEVFLARGYEGATMEGISAAAGVTRANIYWYFKSKDDIFAAVMTQLLTRNFRALEAEGAGLDAMSRLTQGVHSVRPYRSLHQAMHDRLLHHEGVHAAHDLWLEWIREMVREMVDELDAGVELDFALVAHLIEAVFEAVHLPIAHRQPPYEMIRFILDLVNAKGAASPRSGA